VSSDLISNLYDAAARADGPGRLADEAQILLIKKASSYGIPLEEVIRSETWEGVVTMIKDRIEARGVRQMFQDAEDIQKRAANNDCPNCAPGFSETRLADAVLKMFPADRLEPITLDWLVQCGGERIDFIPKWAEEPESHVRFMLYDDVVESPSDDSKKRLLHGVEFFKANDKDEWEVQLVDNDAMKENDETIRVRAWIPSAAVRNKGEVRALLEALGGEATA
jgi:hypothetical protein